MCVACFLLVSCQATPEHLVVREKESLLNEQNAEPVAEPYQCPTSWEGGCIINDDDFEVQVNATIAAPKSGHLPIARIEPIDISDEMAQNIINVLFEGKKIYYGDGKLTKEEIERLLIEERAKFTDPDSVINVQTDPEMKEIKRQGVQQKIDQLTEQIKTAPETSTLTEAKEFRGYKGLSILTGEASLGKAETAFIDIQKEATNTFNFIRFYNLNSNETIKLNGRKRESLTKSDESNTDDLRSISISVDEALSIANDIKDNIGAKELQLDCVNSTIIDNPTDYRVYYECPQCYVFRYTRSVNDVSVTYDNTIETSGEFTKSRMYESMTICIDDNGVCALSWYSPKKLIEVVNDSVQLLSFEEIKKIFTNQIAIKGIWSNETDIFKRTIVVDEIVLGLMSVEQKDNPNELLLIPVWDFYGYTELTYKNPSDTQYKIDDDNKMKYRNHRRSFLTINAMDRTIINRANGY